MDTEKIKRMVNSHLKLFRLGAKVFNSLIPKNRLHVRGVRLRYGVTLMRGLKIDSHGTDNEVVMGDFVQIKDSAIIIDGSHNRVTIGDYSVLNQVEVCMLDDHNEFTVGQHTGLCGKTEIAIIEGTRLVIGDRCMLSGNLYFRTGDSHSVLDMAGRRVNPSKDIVIGNHVWIGAKVTCLKGVTVPDDCIVGAATTLCRQYREPNTVIAGVPGKVVKTGVTWSPERFGTEAGANAESPAQTGKGE